MRPVVPSIVLPSDAVSTVSSQMTAGQDTTIQLTSVPGRSSESTSDGVVAWFGPLSFRSSTLCEVELVSGVTPDYRLTQMLACYLLSTINSQTLFSVSKVCVDFYSALLYAYI